MTRFSFLFLFCSSCLVLSWTISVASQNCDTPQCEAYLKAREALIGLEDSLRFDTDIVLNSKEQAVDAKLQMMKEAETQAFAAFFPPSYNFRIAKLEIDASSKVFPIIQSMPKGGILHIHAIMDAVFLFNYATYRSDCYINVGQTTSDYLQGSFLFSPQGTPPNVNGTQWANVVQLRAAAANKTLFDENLFRTLQFFTPDNDTENDMWVTFDQTIGRVESLGSYLPVWKVAIPQALSQLVKDGVFHVELRKIPSVYNESGTYLSPPEVIRLLQGMIADFNQKSSTKVTFRLISGVLRRDGEQTVYNAMVEVVQLRRNFSDMVVGFDLVDEEDRYHRLIYYLEDFFNIQEYIAENNDLPLPYFFHAGETAWTEGRSEMNLFDAILLNTTRIGHGYALKNHPLLSRIVKDRGIALEVCPISNQMLKVVGDLRNHPGNIFIAEGLPITLSSDDPIIYGYTGVSYDFYEAYMAWDISLKGLKQLTINSIRYSALDPASKKMQLAQLQTKWNAWIDQLFIVLGK